MQDQQQTPQDKAPNRALDLHHDSASLSYEDIKKRAIANSPMVTSVALSRFELGRNKTIKMDGKTLPISDKAWSNFLKKVLHVDPQFVKRFKAVTDDKTELAMLQTLKSGMALKKEQMVHILANPFSKSITAFSSGRHTFRTNEALLEIFERVMNSFPILRVRDFYFMEDGTLRLSARSSEETAGPIKSEIFRGGLTFGNDFVNGSSISHNAFRMICMNGMFGFADMPLFVGPKEKDVMSFFTKLRELDDNHWMQDDFFQKMEDAMNVSASVAELNFAKTLMIGNSAVNNETLSSFLPEYREAEKWLAKKRVNMSELTTAQQRNCPTNVNMWDLINQLTDFGSHNYGVEADFGAIQNGAGHMFAKQFDAKNLVIFE